MAERRYGFRFSFAEGCVIVGSMIGASFLVFLFGVYTGRELEARKTAENTRTVRVNSSLSDEKTPDMLLTGIEANATTREQDKTGPIPQRMQEQPKTVVVVTPQKPTEQIVTAPVQPPPPALPEEEASIKTELLQKTLSASVKKEEKPPPPVVRIPQETKPSPEAKTAALSRKESSTKGNWSVQVHATRDQESARRFANQLRNQGYAPVVSKIVRDREVWYRVRIGSFASADEARASGERFRREGKFSQAYPVRIVITASVKEAIARVAVGRDLMEDEMAAVTAEIMDGQATPAQIGALLTGLHIKGETVGEIAGAARIMRERALHVHAPREVLDTCGTGGDGCLTFNISTAAALVAAGAGLCVAKHGNRAMSGAVGGADVLETLGAQIELSPEVVERCLAEAGFGFLLAPAFHRAMRHAIGPRREIGIRTIFNILGPLTNPAGARHQLIGVFARRWLEPLAESLGRLGSIHALVVHGEDGLDEVSLTGTTAVAEWKEGKLYTFSIHPQELGFSLCRLADLQVTDAQESAAIIRAVCAGSSGPHRDIVVLNAAAALYAGDLASSLEIGVELAKKALDTGAAARALEHFIVLSHTEAL